MKAVLVGSDFMYRQDGTLAPIEINTNVAYDETNRLELTEDIWHFDEFVQFVQENNIREIYLERRLSQPRFLDAVSKAVGELVAVFPINNLEEFEKIEDRDDRLLCRNSYSDEAIVDAYCRDKAEFLNLIKREEIGTEYVLKQEDGTVKGEITELPDNGNYPNFIVKYRYPQYDTMEYPKMFKFDSLQSVQMYAEDVMEEDYFISPFYFNPEKSYEEDENSVWKRLRLFRDWSFFVADSNGLRSISFATYTKVTKPVEDDKLEYESDGMLKSEYRDMFLTKRPFQVANGEVLVEDSDLVLIGDGTWKRADELKEKDVVMSLNVPTSGGVDIRKHTEDYNISYKELQEGSRYVTASVASMGRVDGYIDKISIEFEDGTDWFDTSNSSYMTIDPLDGTVRFIEIGNLEVGNEVILLDTTMESPTYVKKTVIGISKVRKPVIGYQLTLDGPHIFITRESSNTVAYASIEHNFDIFSSCICLNIGTVGFCDCSCIFGEAACRGTDGAACELTTDNCSK